MITSNNEKALPDAFLRRCFFHYIKFDQKPQGGGTYDSVAANGIRAGG